MFISKYHSLSQPEVFVREYLMIHKFYRGDQYVFRYYLTRDGVRCEKIARGRVFHTLWFTYQEQRAAFVMTPGFPIEAKEQLRKITKNQLLEAFNN